MKDNDINININPIEKKEPIYTQVAKWITSTISNAKWTKIFKVYFVTFFFLATALAALYTYNVIRDVEFVKETSQKLIDNRKDDNVRESITTPKVQHDIEVLLYSLGADRVFIFEMHNGKKNTSGLPFTYADMSYEVANRERNIDRCYMKFQDIPLTMYTFPEYMRKNKFFMGTTEDLQEIDYEFGKYVKEEGGKYFVMIYMYGENGALGFLGLSFHDMQNVPDPIALENKVKSYGATIGELLDLQKQIGRIND